ncbi:MAG: hypothetical protein C4K60_17425 [Ideonella sp. MAG2]|nr:MAG: hypothetical protein C4K60_17425 [Ideonella sp. MAG2]
MTYRAPVKDMLFVMKELANLEAVAQLPGFEDAGLDTAQAVLEECAKFNEDVVAPLNWEGDINPSFFKDGTVTATPGFKQAFAQYTQGGWQGLHHPSDFGGQGLPKLIHSACQEMVNAANMSFALCPLLTDGAIEALLTAGSEAQKEAFIPKMIDGTWTGTMNLTEPQAGSDLAAVRTRAEPQADGTYKIFGTKIFITWGEHDMAENLVHLVLARVVGAPEGVKGISLFIVPKFLVNADGSLGARNDVHCVSIEHKMGIKASPTAVLQYGDHGGAIGYLVGQENRGLEYMFVMMNAARFGVGTTAIQANDLIGRKTARDGGQTAKAIAAQIEATEQALAARKSEAAQAFARRLGAARQAYLDVVDFVVGNTKASPNAVFAGSVNYLMLAGNLVAGWQMGRALLAAEDRLAAGDDVSFMQAKITTARFYGDHILTRVPGLRDSIVDGAAGVTDMALEAF